MSKLSEELTWRGFVNQTTYDDITTLDGEPISFYWGVDPSADSMTIGNLAAAMMVRHLIDHGHKAYLLVGGATGIIGDPDGKKDERKIKALEEIARNKAAISAQYKTVFAGKDFTIVDNYDWFKDISYIDFLREVGKNVPMSQMLGREFVQSRLGEQGSGISYAEFSYSLMQGYDFLHLYREHGVTLQVCGADQWGNSIAGVDMIRRIEGGQAHVYSVPLVINKETGVKFGKSEDGAVWLDPNKTSVFSFYQFWINIDDGFAKELLRIYTLLDRQEIERLDREIDNNPGAREAQKVLAREVTALVHGKDRTASIERVTEVLFGGANFASLGDDEIDILASEIPVSQIHKSVVYILVSSGVASSNGDARRLIANGAISINGKKIESDLEIKERSLIKKGKNVFVLVK